MDIGIIKLDIGYSYLFSDFVAQTLELWLGTNFKEIAGFFQS